MQFPNIFVYSIVNFHILTALSHNGTRTGEETLCSRISKCNESLLFFKCYFIYFPFKKSYLLKKKNFYPSHTKAVNLEAQSTMNWLRVPPVLNFCAPFVNSMFVFFERTKTVFLLLSPHLFFTLIVMFHLSIYPLPS